MIKVFYNKIAKMAKNVDKNKERESNLLITNPKGQEPAGVPSGTRPRVFGSMTGFGFYKETTI
jgi:hypothetical protein